MQTRYENVDYTKLSDEELVKHAQQGALDAFSTLYERHLNSVYKRVWYGVPEQDVEDVTQEVFIAAMKSLKSFRGDAKFTTWLRTLTTRKVADYYRRTRRKSADLSAEMELKEEHENLPVQESGLSTVERIHLQDALNQVPEHYREVVLLRFAEGLSFKEIAQVQGNSLEATKSLFRRAIAALKTQVGESHA
ncbi:MAG: RNA polymerase sigma factor [Chloroflexi bacterium]|nr:MAG: RNA polymerase sigma factor [Chloroflexota bacterium]MBL1195418.1 RNA polymerase sigma factor [Chloroflexota bacterium]NOH12701.1 RNA polymerase sigma factor [Chloroflexota bacterium]